MRTAEPLPWGKLFGVFIVSAALGSIAVLTLPTEPAAISSVVIALAMGAAIARVLASSFDD
jgi:hypothetical protein